ncbi:hypothetical protein FGB62_42g31 [Gracilaria domingensis]|nr:hypothetical protein FGB62_42g31 [Gracilaria domingensis]
MIHPTVFLFFTYLVSFTTASPVSPGISGSPCLTASQCQGTRTCYYVPLDSLSSFGPCDSRDECFCAPVDITDLICQSDDDCVEEGEVCATFPGLSVSGCIALETVNKYPQLTRTGDVMDGNVDAEISSLPSDEPFDDLDVTPTGEPFGGLDAKPTGEPFDDLDAEPTDEPVMRPPAEDAPPFSESEGIQGVGASSELEPSVSPQSETSCIGVHHLQHMSAAQLMYDNHVRAKVLCDEHGSCATAGHMVRFDGRAMMMKSYCMLVECESTVELVNSPKYARKVSVPSRSPRLHFTAFAARYGSRAEEMLLRAAVRVGL